MNSNRLLAKSLPTDSRSTDSVFLPGHHRDVIEAARAVLNATANEQLASLGLDSEKWHRRFERIILLAAAIHDLGKANDHFQGIVQPEAFKRRRGLRQGLRHEWVSVLLAWDEEFALRDSLARAVHEESDFWIALWAVGGHHPAYGRPSPPRFAAEGTGDSMTLMMDHEDFAAAARGIASQLTVVFPADAEVFRNRRLPLVGPDNAFERLFQFHRASRRAWAAFGGESRGTDLERLTAAAKDCLVAADIAGSALPRDISDSVKRRAWIVDGFCHRPTPDNLAELIANRLSSDNHRVSVEEIDANLRPFQRDVAASDARVTFIKAGCGTGKTLAAYEWARRQVPGRRLFFCYPTTGTATEGFRDYLVENGVAKSGADLFHSRQAVDFEILGVRGGAERGVDDLAEAGDLAVRVAGLESWSTPIVACTCDTVLGIIQNNRRGLYSWPALAGAAFIFDEIHAYDDRLFGALLRFLEAMRGVKILLMTASLPAAREAAIVRCLKQMGESVVGDLALSVVSGPKDLENLGRYHRLVSPSKDELLQFITDEMNRGGKMLWVCNTVDRAMDAFDEAVKSKLQPILYHSRFRYEDRVARHAAVIDSFRNDGPALAICTQVAEMSLDLSATLLVSDLAPVPSLIQRLGRLDRRAKPPRKNEPPPRTMPFVVVEPIRDGQPFHLPYTPEDFDLARRWLASLPEGTISQQSLAATWEGLDGVPTRRPAFVASAWLDGGPETQVLELREGSPGITVFMPEDEAAVRRDPRRLARVSIPMPPPPKWIRDRLLSAEGMAARVKGVFAAELGMIDYTADKGGRWRKEPA